MFNRISGVFQRFQQWEILGLRTSKPSGRVSVTFPDLRLDHYHFGYGTSLSQKFHQPFVPVVQVDPHRNRETEHDVES